MAVSRDKVKAKDKRQHNNLTIKLIYSYEERNVFLSINCEDNTELFSLCVLYHVMSLVYLYQTIRDKSVCMCLCHILDWK